MDFGKKESCGDPGTLCWSRNQHSLPFLPVRSSQGSGLDVQLCGSGKRTCEYSFEVVELSQPLQKATTQGPQEDRSPKSSRVLQLSRGLCKQVPGDDDPVSIHWGCGRLCELLGLTSSAAQRARRVECMRGIPSLPRQLPKFGMGLSLLRFQEFWNLEFQGASPKFLTLRTTTCRGATLSPDSMLESPLLSQNISSSLSAEMTQRRGRKKTLTARYTRQLAGD